MTRADPIPKRSRQPGPNGQGALFATSDVVSWPYFPVIDLDADSEPASLATLRGEAERLLAEVEIADLPLEVHGWTEFLDEYFRMAGAGTREPACPGRCRRCWSPKLAMSRRAAA